MKPFQPFEGNASLLFGGYMEKMKVEITKKEEPIFFAALKRALLFSLSAQGLLSPAQMEAVFDDEW